MCKEWNDERLRLDKAHQKVIQDIDAYFASGNSIPVERASIKRTEWDAAKEAIIKATIERCAVTAMNSCFVPPDGGSPSAEAVAACDMAYSRISQLSVKDILESVK